MFFRTLKLTVTMFVTSLFLTNISFAGGSSCINEYAATSNPVSHIEPVISVTKLSDSVSAILFGEELNEIAEFYHNHGTKLAYAMKNRAEGGQIWISVKEGVDSNMVPAIWMELWVNTTEGCVHNVFGHRISFANTPTTFWNEVLEWEEANPDSSY